MYTERKVLTNHVKVIFPKFQFNKEFQSVKNNSFELSLNKINIGYDVN